MASRESVLQLFIALSIRPHRFCIHRFPKAPPGLVRHFSSSIAAHGPKTTLVPNQAVEDVKSNPIPLHVGLDRNPESVSAISRIPIPKGEKGEKFVPQTLSRPLGLQHPPRRGQNSPIDRRTLSERKHDFASYEKALERRRVYLRSFFRPYFQEWRRVDHWKGKSFVSNDRLFRREKALYFPNIWGQTLAKDGDGPDGGRDTTDVLVGKISIIGMQSGQWAEEQVDTFLGAKSNPELEGLLAKSQGLVQRVDINMQGDWARAMLVKLFKSRLRRIVPESQWARYFMIKLPRDIRRGLTDEVRDAMGLLNSQVGYVYLVDSSCKIRWAGSGHAWDGEVKGLNLAIRRLMKEELGLGSRLPEKAQDTVAETDQKLD